jgi:membrane protease YdiL (CAAX protease family)
MAQADGRSVWFYFLVAFAIPWGTVLWLSPSILGGTQPAGETFVLMFVAMLAGPVVGAVVVTLINGGGGGLRELGARLFHWRVGRRYYALAVLAVPATIILTLAGFGLFMPGFTPAALAENGMAALTMGLAAGLVAGFFEEIGWSGVATPLLRRRYSVLATGLLLGALHGAWHFPAGFASEGASYGWLYLPHFLMFWMVGLIALRLLIVWLYERTASLPVAQLTHASYTGGLFALWPSGVDQLTGTWWAATFAATLLVAVLAITALRPGARAAASR